MIDTIAVIAAIAEKKKFSDHMETTLQRSQRPATIELFISQPLLSLRSLKFFFLRIAAITAMVAIIW